MGMVLLALSWTQERPKQAQRPIYQDDEQLPELGLTASAPWAGTLQRELAARSWHAKQRVLR